MMFAFREAHGKGDARSVPEQLQEHGERIVSGRRGRTTTVTERELRVELLRDLNELLNTVNMEAAFDLAEFPRVRESILNYGIHEISNRTIDEDRLSDILGEIRTALLLFEPRLVPETVNVTRDMSVNPDSLNIRFEVSGDMMADPVAVAVEFVADIDAGTGKMRIGRK